MCVEVDIVPAHRWLLVLTNIPGLAALFVIHLLYIYDTALYDVNITCDMQGPRCSIRSKNLYSDCNPDYFKMVGLNLPAAVVVSTLHHDHYVQRWCVVDHAAQCKHRSFSSLNTT